MDNSTGDPALKESDVAESILAISHGIHELLEQKYNKVLAIRAVVLHDTTHYTGLCRSILLLSPSSVAMLISPGVNCLLVEILNTTGAIVQSTRRLNYNNPDVFEQLCHIIDEHFKI